MSKSENSLIQPFSDMTFFYTHLIVHMLQNTSTVLFECMSISEQHYHSGSISHHGSSIWSNTTVAVCKGYAVARL